MSDLKPTTLRELWGSAPDARHADEAAAPSEPVAWAVVNESGDVDDGRIWRHRDKAERFHAHASRNPDREYRIVPLYTRPAPRKGVTPEMVDRAFVAFTGHTADTKYMTDSARLALRDDLHDALTAALAEVSNVR